MGTNSDKIIMTSNEIKRLNDIKNSIEEDLKSLEEYKNMLIEHDKKRNKIISCKEIDGHFETFGTLKSGYFKGKIMIYDNNFFEGIVNDYDYRPSNIIANKKNRFIYGVYDNEFIEFVKISDSLVSDPFVFRLVKDPDCISEFTGNLWSIMPTRELAMGYIDIDTKNIKLSDHEVFNLHTKIIEFLKNDDFSEIYDKFVKNSSLIYEITKANLNNGKMEQLCTRFNYEKLAAIWQIYNNGYGFTSDTAKKVQAKRDKNNIKLKTK